MTRALSWLPEGALILTMALWRFALLAADAFPLHGDEAVVLLMARHILQGARPIFFYGQAYMGSLDAYLIAAAFALGGESVLVARLVQVGLYAALLALTSWGLRWAWGPAVARQALLYLAFAPVLLVVYGVVTLGGYNEALLLGTAGLLWAAAGSRKPCSREAAFGRGVGLGFLLGVGAWVLLLSWVYLLPAAVYVALRWRRCGRPPFLTGVGGAVLGAGLGAWPIGLFVARQGWRALMAASPTASFPHFAHPWWRGIPWHGLLLGTAGFPVVAGVRVPWSLAWRLPLPLGALVLAVHALALVGWWKTRRTAAWWLVSGVVVTNALLYVFTPYGGDPTGRYFLPWAHAAAVMMAVGLSRVVPARRWRYGLLAGLCLAQSWVTWQAARAPGGLSPVFLPSLRVDAVEQRALTAFLLEQDLTLGYTNYWIAYPLAFLSQERLQYAPRLPYHENLRYSVGDDRIPAYTQAAACAQRIAYVTFVAQQTLNTRLRSAWIQRGLTWRETRLAGYMIYYDLRPALAPWDVGLGPAPEVSCAQRP